MKQPDLRSLLFLLLIISMGCPSTSFGYGGGGGGGGGTEDAFAGMAPTAGGGVSWAPNPNGADVVGSSIWDGRPENIEHGPYQPDKAVQDAEAELLSGFQSGNYTAPDVKKHLGWAQRVGIKISPQAIKVLHAIDNPPVPPKTPATSAQKPTNPAKPASWVSKALKHKDDADVHLSMLQDYLDQANKGKKPTKVDVGLSFLKHKLKKWLNKFAPPEKSPDRQ